MKKLVLLLLIVPIIVFSWDGLKSNSEIFLFYPTFINSELVLNEKFVINIELIQFIF